MKKEYVLKAGRKIKVFSRMVLKQNLSDEDEYGRVACEVRLSDDLPIGKDQLVKVTIEPLSKELSQVDSASYHVVKAK